MMKLLLTHEQQTNLNQTNQLQNQKDSDQVQVESVHEIKAVKLQS